MCGLPVIRLVVNADDLGLHPRLDEGIFQAHTQGIVTSASLLVNGSSAGAASKRANDAALPLGVHLCLTGHAVPSANPAQVRWLAPGGRFRRNWKELSAAWFSGLIPEEELEIEFTAQIVRAKDLGVKVDHLDVHEHLHVFPGIGRVVERLAASEHLPVRWPQELPRPTWIRKPKSFTKAMALSGLSFLQPHRGARRVRTVGIFDKGGLTEARLIKLLGRLGDGDWELMCHPGLSPGSLTEVGATRYSWESELEALTSPKVREVLREKNITLTSYRGLFGRHR